jgi:outer membrane protein assembly factor BamB
MLENEEHQFRQSFILLLFLISFSFVPNTETSLGIVQNVSAIQHTSKTRLGAWPRFRGYSGAGIVKDDDFPIAWNCTDSNSFNVKWKNSIPYLGHSSPVVFSGRIFITGIDSTKDRGLVFCFDTQTGKMIWQREALAKRKSNYKPHKKLYDPAVAAAATMTVDGNRAYAFFANSDLVAIDYSGAIIWSRNLGSPNNAYGHASSLALYNNLLIIQIDQALNDDDSFNSKLYALDCNTGKDVWIAQRPVGDSWTTPIIAHTDTGPQIITVASPWIIAYNPSNGQEIWKVNRGGSDFTPSPVYANGLALAIAPSYEIYAIKTTGTGNVTDTHIAWTYDMEVPDICSPVVKDDLVFLLMSGILICLDLDTGDKVWDYEFDNDFESSPTVVGNMLYIFSKEGNVFVLAADRQYKELSRAYMGEKISATPAFVDNCIYIRGKKHLFCVEKQ